MKLTISLAQRGVLWAVMLFTAAPALAFADVYVIVYPGLNLTADDIKNIYTGEKELAESTKIRPQDNSSAREEFLKKVLQLDAAKYESLWTKKSFRDGINPPTVRASDAEVIAYVKSNPGAIGYVTTAPPGDVTVLKKF
jgi:ABC-type phosphate transport system substrate-binding protein